ncbi:PLD nuclease N-terminal domain-containing protein [Zhouia amylolytica]|uniref:Cardiolipin synthase N-terminal domain-containing protein n=1 Tax=Zhouia amylolytica AD3 TaxID=1286632 RepID=W2UKF4_9FLAO|nr:PLD nuclease N-terminal domain-containing protein [Zhouia amylolytica]ETN94640.1 hypothetical protein P278_25830 [Zhouia amylolytica AD3]
MTHFLGMIGPWQILMLILILFIIPVIFAIIDIVKHEFEGYGKIIWLLVVLFFYPIGVVLYFLIGRSQRIKKV